MKNQDKKNIKILLELLQLLLQFVVFYWKDGLEISMKFPGKPEQLSVT